MPGTEDWFSDLNDLLARADKVARQSKEACCEAREVVAQLFQTIETRSSMASHIMTEAAQKMQIASNAA